MGGGKERKASMQMQTDLARQQSDLSKQYNTMAQGELARRGELQNPLIEQNKRLMSSNPSERMTAIAPALADQTRAAQSARGAIEDQPRGAGREFALAQLPMQQYSQASDLLNKAYMGAFQTQAALGTESGNVGLQQAGAGLRGAEGAANANQSVIQAQQQQKASQLGMIGSIAGLGGAALSGGLGAIGKASAAKMANAGSVFSNLYKYPSMTFPGSTNTPR